MADEDDSQKTEEPTQRRIEEALKKGQMIHSREITHFLLLLSLVLTLKFAAPALMHTATVDLRYFVEHSWQLRLDDGNLGALLKKLGALVLFLLLVPALGGLVAGIGSSLLQQGGFRLTPLSMKWDKISPMKGIKRLFSMQSIVEFLKGIVKLIIVGFVAWIAVRPYLFHVKLMHTYSIADALALLLKMAIKLLIGVCIVMGVLAIFDYLYQRYEFYKGLKMSKQDLKEEYKETEGSPEIKGKLKQMRMERARKRMMAAVPKADVVITNPTHFSVALIYDSSTMAAPKVVAKGQDLIALNIREIAKKHDVPLYENAPLARALYDTVDIDREIPLEHYKAVAEIISYVYRLKGKQMESRK